MYARVTFVQMNPEDLEDAARDFDDSVIPAARQEEGFEGALLLVRADGTAMVVDLSDTLDHMQANERSGFYQSQVAKFRNRIVGHPRREIYHVAVARGVRGGIDLLEEAS
ncbi:MAG: hypothetical protein M3401_13380 [Actinomycetota bacterium]|nr:hypothetical protein [Actinomycetota bacterium]